MGEVISGSYEGEWKDWIDNIRYITTSVDYWEHFAVPGKKGYESEYDRIMGANNSKSVDWVV